MPAENLGKTTRLSAVNSMLAALGESPTTDLSSPSRSDVNSAVDLLDSTSREVQARGWFFNQYQITMDPDTSNQIALPETILNVEATSYRVQDQVVERNGLLFNTSENSFSFQNPTEVLVIVHLPFEQIPEPARNYIARRASRVLQENRVGDPTLVKFAERLEGEALYLLQETEVSNGDYSSFRNLSMAQLFRPHIV